MKEVTLLKNDHQEGKYPPRFFSDIRLRVELVCTMTTHPAIILMDEVCKVLAGNMRFTCFPRQAVFPLQGSRIGKVAR